MEKYSRLDRASDSGLIDLDKLLEKYRIAVEKAIRDSQFQDSPLSEDAQAVMEAGGKRLRPILVLMSCEAVSGQYTTALPASLAYELAHEASLVQDDIIDNSDLRHDKETVHKKRGLTGAILVSDLLIFDIFAQLAKYESSALGKKRITRLMSYISRSASLTITGEFLESHVTKQPHITENDYLKVAGLKTGSLLGAASASGALVGGASEKAVDAMYRFGFNLGIAFQIRDDILDISGDPSKLGKPVMKDLQNNACNIVLINAIEKADVYQQNLLSSLIYKKWFTAVDMKGLMNLLGELRSVEYASKLAERYTSMSRDCLKVLRGSPAKDRLVSLTYALETRKV
ncbi:MAG: polyprenyl synthetase family protein [Nitrososphaerota archaeon]|nr:polyprenyl synthetase family protein [Nitrososphaerota archaeon]MDG6922027.1 polyprenyl synthetase family protein [Nitrososphaerota archaeon]